MCVRRLLKIGVLRMEDGKFSEKGGEEMNDGKAHFI